MRHAGSFVVSGIGEGVQVGDRFEVDLVARDRITLVRPLFELVEELVDEGGHPLEFSAEADSASLCIPALFERTATGVSALWLVHEGEGRFRFLVEPAGARGDEELSTADGETVELDAEDWPALTGPKNVAGVSDWQLTLRGIELATHGGFEQLMCLPTLRDVELLDHQLRTAKTVLRRFRGRALLCDEVGLGKTIEAGLILSELRLRGLARSILILTPPSLVEQWQGEMRRKFAIDCLSHDSPEFRSQGEQAWGKFDRIIASLHTAKREPHRSAILSRRWDLVIVDEAHHLRNRATQMWKFASQIQKQYILLLTATPVQNDLQELFNLVTLLEPGLLSTSKQFQKRFMDRQDKVTPRNVDQLHQLLSEVMVRNQRSTTGLQFTRRWARTLRVPLGASERELYDEVTRFIRQWLRSRGSGAGMNRMVLLTLQMALGSSSAAAASTLRRLSEQPRIDLPTRRTLAELAERADQSESAKVARLLELLEEFPDKLVVFTQFRATQDLLAERLMEQGHEVAVFHGGLRRMEKEAAIEQFRGSARLLLCTESGSEGRNLQFAHGLCNFDLPWNPMKIEQRVGRLSRIGQTHDVHVFNLVSAGTIEDAVLHLLEAKLNMFEMVIGEIDMVLGNLDDEREFQDVIADLWLESEGEEQFRQRVEQLGDRLLSAKEDWLRQRAHDERIFGDRFAPEK